MSYLNNDPVGGQCPEEPDNALGETSSIMSLTGLVDLLSALEPELSMLPPPYHLFAHELADGIAAAIGEGSDDF